MKRVTRYFAAVAILALLAACASGPKYNEVSAKLTPPNAGTERIWFYRTAVLGAAVQPEVKLNGQVVGKAVPSGFFYEDVAPGDYTVTTATELEKKLTFTLEKGQPRYVRLDISMGLFVGHVYGVLVDEPKAKEELASTSYVGTKVATK
jgi:hypothetical protein